jgi:hypothetical protein
MTVKEIKAGACKLTGFFFSVLSEPLPGAA